MSAAVTATPTLLVTLTGPDRPGLTSALFSALSGHDVDVVDVEQVVIRGRLILGVLLAGAPAVTEAAAIGAAVQDVAAALGLDAEVSPGGADDGQPRRRDRVHVTLLGHPLQPGPMAAIARRIAEAGAPTSTASCASRTTR